MLCTVHFGFVSPFFCPFVESWPLLSTLYCFMFILSLFYCFIIIWAYHCFIWSYMGLKEKLSSYYLVSWATLFLILFSKILNSIYSAKWHCSYNSYIFFLNLFVFFSLFKYLWKLIYIYCFTDKTNFIIFSQLLTCVNALKHYNYKSLVSWATFFSF